MLLGRSWSCQTTTRKDESSGHSRPGAIILSLVAVFVMLTAYGAGQTVNQDPAIENDLASANQGHMDAQLRVAQAYNEGTYGWRNYGEAFKWFQAASTQGSAEATAWMGHLYLTGRGVAQDTTKGISLIQAAADAQNPVGQRLLGMMYQNGEGAPRDYGKALSLYSAAAAQNDANSFDRMASLYLHGLGVPKDVKKAASLFSQGASLGDSWAQLHLAQMFQGGHAPSTPGGAAKKQTGPDYASALKLYGLSAAQGNRVAAYKLGEMYEKGLGTAQDYSKALSYYQQSARHRYVPAQLALARANELGNGTAVNFVNAYVLYSLAAEQENNTAVERLRFLEPKLSRDQLQQAQMLLRRADAARQSN